MILDSHIHYLQQAAAWLGFEPIHEFQA